MAKALNQSAHHSARRRSGCTNGPSGIVERKPHGVRITLAVLSRLHYTHRQRLRRSSKMVRLNLYNQDLFCGAQAIYWEMEELGVTPLPSIRTINRILSRNDLTHRRTGKYEAKGTAYPKLPSLLQNQAHQADLVGPCYLKGPVRFYSLNVVDTAIVRYGFIHPCPSPGNPSLTVSGPSGCAWEYRTTSRLTILCPSLEPDAPSWDGTSHSERH